MRLILVKPMCAGRTTFLLVLAVLVCHSRAATPTVSARAKYYDRLWNIILQRAAPQLAKHPEQAVQPSAPVKLTYRVRADGSVGAIKILSGSSRGFLVETFINAIRSAKFPPIPAAVLKELGTPYADPELSLDGGDFRRH